MHIPFNRPYLSAKEVSNVVEALQSRTHCGNNSFGKRCVEWMENLYGFQRVYLTPSCTAAMEMGAILADLKSEDEVILPSWTFSSTANAVILTGAKPVFCEINPDTMNIDVNHIERLITPKTRMILPIDYMGIPCDIDRIMQIALKNNLLVMQDAAQSLHSRYKNRWAGTSAHFSAFSFHETKNFSCGEGGALCLNDERFIARAEILQEKGTDRSLVLKGLKSKYSWVDKGSSYLMADLLAAQLLAQLEAADEIVGKRKKITDAYTQLLFPWQEAGHLKMPRIPEEVTINHHAFFVIFDSEANQTSFLTQLKELNVHAYIGYLPLHSSKMGQKFGYKAQDLAITEDLSKRIVRLPLFPEMADNGLDYCLASIKSVLELLYGKAK